MNKIKQKIPTISSDIIPESKCEDNKVYLDLRKIAKKTKHSISISKKKKKKKKRV